VIYIMQVEEIHHIKIGYSETADGVQERLRTLQTGCPLELVVISQQPGDIASEYACHRALINFAMRGEWFRWCADTRAFVIAFHVRGVFSAIQSLGHTSGQIEWSREMMMAAAGLHLPAAALRSNQPAPLLRPPVDEKQRYTVNEALALLRISRAWLYSKIDAKELAVIKDGRRTYIPGAEIARLSRTGA